MRKKRELSFFICFIIIATQLLGGLSRNIIYAKASDDFTYQNINLGASVIHDPTSTTEKATHWMGSRVYYGKKGTQWRVLDQDGLLFAEDYLEKRLYNEVPTLRTVTWETSTLRSYLNGYSGIAYKDYPEENFINHFFTKSEAEAIKTTHITTQKNKFSGGNPTDDKIFVLAIEEIENKSYGFGSEATRTDREGNVDAPKYNNGAIDWYWLRSPGGKASSYVATVNFQGVVNKATGSSSKNGDYPDGKLVRPAFNLDMSAVLFTTADGVSKKSYGKLGSAESVVKADAAKSDLWKLTMKGTNQSLGVKSESSTEITKREDTVLTITHKSAKSILTDATQISAMLLDKSDQVLYYGSINSDCNATTSKVVIPGNLEEGNYTLRFFAEDVNEDDMTDFASAFSDMPISVKEVPVNKVEGIPNEVQLEKAEEIHLAGQVIPESATYTEVTYTIKDAGDTGAVIEDNKLILSGNGTGSITVIVTVKNGKLNGDDYQEEIVIDVSKKESVENIPSQDISSKEETTPVTEDTSSKEESTPVIENTSSKEESTSVTDDTSSKEESIPNVEDTNNQELIVLAPSVSGKQSELVNFINAEISDKDIDRKTFLNKSKMININQEWKVETSEVVNNPIISTKSNDQEMNRIQPSAMQKEKAVDTSKRKLKKSRHGNITWLLLLLVMTSPYFIRKYKKYHTKIEE
ncbi:hypothetical protein lbkm_3856 [Lachnospiraceae bacterium KM106-2]|nr:hypothetical protein lbkm_3856 [Lachnospiraceae bacterium KM106-2]